MKFIGDKMKSIIITKTGETLKYDSVLEAQPMLNRISRQYGKKINYYEAIDQKDQKVRIYDVFYK